MYGQTMESEIFLFDQYDHFLKYISDYQDRKCVTYISNWYLLYDVEVY